MHSHHMGDVASGCCVVLAQVMLAGLASSQPLTGGAVTMCRLSWCHLEIKFSSRREKQEIGSLKVP